MSQNLVSMAITKEQQASALALIAQITELLDGLISLDPEERRSLIKMGAGGDRFVRIVLRALQHNPDMVPRNLDVTGAAADLEALEMALPIIAALQQVMARLEDTRTALGSDLMHFANRGYALMQANGSASGLEDALNEASYRYAKRRRKPKPEGEK